MIFFQNIFCLFQLIPAFTLWNLIDVEKNMLDSQNENVPDPIKFGSQENEEMAIILIYESLVWLWQCLHQAVQIPAQGVGKYAAIATLSLESNSSLFPTC